MVINMGKEKRAAKPRDTAKEAREIAKWERQAKRRKPNFYLLYLILIVTVMYVVDEIATAIGTQMRTEIAGGLFGAHGDRSLSVLGTVNFVATLFLLFGVLVKPLADRYGRKLFLILNTFGMGLGMFFIFLSPNIPVFILGTIIMGFFIPNDIQVLYIMESSPGQHRAKIYSVIKSLAALGIMLVPLFRRIFMTDVSLWRMVFLVPALLGMGAAIFGLLFVRETDTFIAQRLSYLRQSDAEREAAQQKNAAESSQGGFRPALKLIFAHKQLKWLTIITLLGFMASLITGNYQAIMTYGYAESYLREGLFANIDDALAAASIGPVTTSLFLFSICSALIQLIPGFIADWLGRKSASLVMTAVTLACFLAFFFGAGMGWSPYVIGSLSGIFVGSYWAIGDIRNIMVTESTPTNLRSSVTAVLGIVTIVGMLPVSVLGIVLIGIFGNASVGMVSLAIAAPALFASLILLLTKTRETKGSDLAKVEG